MPEPTTTPPAEKKPEPEAPEQHCPACGCNIPEFLKANPDLKKK